MPISRLALPAVWALLSFSVAACATHAPPARSGEVARPAPIVSGVIPQTARLLPNKLLIDARLNQPITTATPEGYAFSTTVTQAISAADGAVAVPAGTVLRGVVTGVRAAGASHATPVVRVALDFLELGGRSYGIRSSVFGVTLNDSVLTSTGTTRPNSAMARVLSPDSARALFPIAPAGVHVGTAIALAPSADGAELPAGSLFIVQLDSAIAIAR